MEADTVEFHTFRKLNQEGGNAPGAVSLDDVDLDQVSVDFVLSFLNYREIFSVFNTL
uniref:Uncharacterized protein n=1 Tax=Solanum tuberosum TaxID=4113 RepID=M1BWB8_SOLTU